MESKQLTRKLNSVFWWILTALPLLLIIGYIIASIVNLNTQNGTALNSSNMFDYWAELDIYNMLDSGLFTMLNYLIPSVLSDSIRNIFSVLEVDSDYLSIILSWGIAIQMYHLIFDVLLFVVRWAQDLMERGVK